MVSAPSSAAWRTIGELVRLNVDVLALPIVSPRVTGSDAREMEMAAIRASVP